MCWKHVTKISVIDSALTRDVRYRKSQCLVLRTGESGQLMKQLRQSQDL